MEKISESRVKNTKRNITSGLIKQFISILLPFIIRTLILYVLGAQYQGLSGLFSSVLEVLNLTDLGFTSAVIFIMYKPVADNDRETLCNIMAFLKKIYSIVGSVILILGILVTPFLKNLISGDIPTGINIYILFLIYLFNAVISYYLFAYKSALLTAMQRDDVVSNAYTISTFVTKIVQITVLVSFKNYYIYVIFLPIGTIVNNLIIEYFSRKYFPDIIPHGSISRELYNNIIKQVKALLIGKIGTVARNSFDNIVLSTLLGLIAVAIYDNYYYIYSALYGVLLVITRSMQASVGNSIVKESKEKNYNDFLKFTFIFMWIIGWCTVCLVCLYQPFMSIWMRNDDKMLLSTFNMLLFCVYFYIINMNNTRNLYLEGKGLYHECRWYFLLEAIGNLLLNFLLGYYWGITGILLATIITIFIFNFITRTNVLFKCYFQFSAREFYCQHLEYGIITIVACGGTYLICKIIPFSSWIGLILRALVCCIVPNFIYFLCYFRTNNFKNGIIFIRKVFKK